MTAVMAAWAATSRASPPWQDPERAADDPIDEPVTATGHPTGRGSVEQVVTVDGVRRYRLVEPAAGDPVTVVQDHP